MPEWTVNDPSGRKIIVTAPEGATQEQVIRYAQQQSQRLFAAPQEEEEEEYSWAYETIGAPVERGWYQLQQTEAIMGGLVGGWHSKEEMAESIAQQQQNIAGVPMSDSVRQGLQDIQEAETWAEAAKEIITNPAAVWDITISSLVSSIPGLVGFVGGLAGGTLIGGPVGGIVGAATGAGTGSLAVEYSQSIVDAMNEAGTDTQNEEQILEFLNNPQKMEVAKKFAINRGIPIALFDALTAGVAGRLFGPTVKAVASTRAFEAASEAGRTAADVARRAAWETGVATTAQVDRQAARAALRAMGKELPLAPKVAGAGVELLSQAIGGGAGEAAAQIVTEGKVKRPGDVMLEFFAEMLPGSIEAIISSRRPRVAPAPRDPSDIPAEPVPLAREAYDVPIRADLDPVTLVEQQARQFAQDTPVSMTDGVPSTNENDYPVVAFTGTDDAGVEFSGWRVETKTGTPITPVIDNEARAEGAREAFVRELDASFTRQEQAELDLRVDEAIAPLLADEHPDLVQAARAADADTTISFNDLEAVHKKKIISWRANNKDEAPRLAAGMVAVEEMSLAGLRDKTINDYLEGAMEVAQKEASVKSIQQLTEARNIKNDDQAFQDFVRRVAGGRSKKNSWRTMGGSQLGVLKERLEELGATLPGEERQSVPVPKRKPFTAPQYNSVISSARRQGERRAMWKVVNKAGPKAGKSVPGGSRFSSKQRAEAFRNNLKAKKGTKVQIKPYQTPLREGEIQKSDVTEVLGGGIKNTDAILNAAVERGDLIKVRGQPGGEKWRVADYAIREAQPLMPGLRKRLAARLRGAGIASDKIALELVERLEGGDKGDYGKRLMRLALEKIPENATPEQATAILGETLDHEVIHALVELGVLTKADMGLLGVFVSRAKVPDTGMTYLEQAYKQYSEHPDYQKKNEKDETVVDEDAIVEEATAEAFRDFAAGRLKVVGKPRSLFRRIIDFFRGLSSLSPADAMYFTARFTPIVEGRVAQRGVPQMEITTGQRDVDLPEEVRPRRRAIDPEAIAREAEEAAAEEPLFEEAAAQADARTPEVPPQEYELSKMDKRKIAELSKKVPRLAPLLKFLRPDEQIILTETTARNLVDSYKTLPQPQEMAAVALSGRVKRGWYKNSARVIAKIFGSDAPRFTALLAALSPRTSVESNTINALRVWAAWTAEGRPTDRASIIRIMGDNVQGHKGEASVLGAWRNNTVKALTAADPTRVVLSGPKANSFMLNLLGFMDEVTNDAWMATYSDIDPNLLALNQNVPLPGKGATYLALNAAVRKAAQLLTIRTGEQWSPAEIQETVWSWAKALYEMAASRTEDRSAIQILQSGDFTHDRIGGVPDFEKLFLSAPYREVLEGAGYADSLLEIDETIGGREAPIEGSAYDINPSLRPHLNRAAKRLDKVAAARRAQMVRSEIMVNLAVSNETIPGLDRLTKEANAGDQSAVILLQEIAGDALSYLTDNIKSANISYVPASGLYFGESEPSLGVALSFREADRPRVLSALAKFGTNFNQAEIHVRGEKQPRTTAGHQYEDGSYNTPTVRFNLKEPLSRKEIQRVIDSSDLDGLTVTDQYLEAYLVGDPTNADQFNDFIKATQRARKSLGGRVQNTRRDISRLWAYGRDRDITDSRLLYANIQGRFRPPSSDRASASALRVASRLANRLLQPSQQALTITPEKQQLQRRIADAYDALRLDGLGDPIVRYAYEQLAQELLLQFDALPIKIEVWERKGEPYGGKRMSAEMREDVLFNNHLYIYGTDVPTFGPPGVTYDKHPLLADSGRTDMNGRPLLYNDILRAVHDYYAHTMSPVTFGPRGEEAAWRNHMLMTNNPWARWALTSETRGQNSWVNFRKGVAGLPLRERQFSEQKVDLLPLEFVMVNDATVDASLAELPGGEGLSLPPPQGEAVIQEEEARPRRRAIDPAVFESMRGRGMSLTLEQQEGVATLVVRSGDQKIEVRGQPGVGAVYEGGSLDRVIDAIPRRANISTLFAGETLHIPPDVAAPVLDVLEAVEEPTRTRRRAVDEKLISGRRDRELTEWEKKALQRSFSGFHNVTPTNFFPLKKYNGGVTPVVIGGKKYPVILLSGKNEWSESLRKDVGWGQKHVALHLDDIVENTNYNSVDSFVSGILNMYNANRIEGTLKEAGFEVFETDNYTDNIRGKKLVIRWWYDRWATPGTIVVQPINFDGIFPLNRELNNKNFASLVTAFALPVELGKYNVRPTQIISPAVSLTAKREANGANANKPILKLSQKEKRKYQINNPEGLDASDRAMLADVMGSTKKERKTLGEYFLGMFRYSESFSRPSRWRWNFVDRWEGVRAVEVALRKKFPDLYADIYADSSAAAMMAMLDRSSGLMQQWMTAGPLMYSRGMFHAINSRIVEAAPPELRTILRQELSDLKARAGYAPNDEVKGFMQILYPLYDLRKYGSFEAWELYAAAKRAKRLKEPTPAHPKGREFMMTDEMIQQGLAIADKPQYQDADGNSVIKQVYDDYQKLNNALILMMLDANLISTEAAQIWRDNSDYLPFYRELFVDDTRGGGLDGQVVYELPITDQDEVLMASKVGTAAGANNNLFQNMYNVPAPRELKGGKATFFIMVNGVRDVKVFDKKTGPKILERIALLKKLNDRPGVPPAKVEVKASTQRIQDPLENILRNANAAITASMRNVGMLRAIRDLGRLNMAERLAPGAESKSIVNDQIGVRINGETVWFHTSDPLLLHSMQATGDLQIPGMSIMSTPANILRELVTKTPDFMLANLMRDTISAWATSGASVWPVIGTALGFGEALGGTGSTALLRASGVFGGYDFKNDPKDAKRALQKYMLRGVAGAGSSKDYLTKGWVPSLKSPLAPAMKLWQFADDITVASDMGTRIAVYNAVLRETGNEAQAAYEALEVINFSRKGRSPAIRFVTAMVPFLNARIQGLDVLWRGSPASADGISSFKVAERKRRFIWRMTTLVALSGAYALAHSDDPEEDPHYANATEEKKDMYFILKSQWMGLNPKTVSVPKIPIGFEVGLFTKVLPERLIRLINGTDDAKAFRQAMGRAVVGTLNMNPIPQFMKPLVEAAVNVRMYDMSAIVPSYSEGNAPEQARAGVGETARELAKITGISAEKIEHILIAYTGTLGRYALQAVDAISRSMAGYPDAPAMNPTEYPFFQRFLQDELGGGDLQSFYALKEALALIANSIAEDEANMNFEQAAERRKENWPLISRKSRIDYLSDRISDLRNQEVKIRADRVMSSEKKRKYIRQIKRLKSDVLTGIRKLSVQINRELRE